MKKSVLLFLGIMSLFSLAAAAAENTVDRLEYAGKGGVKYVVTADGLSSISVGGREIAKGGWYAWNAGPCWFGKGSKGVLDYTYYSKEVYGKAAKDLKEKSIEIISPDHAKVRHVQPNAVATYDYKFDGEDVTISARLENNHPEAEIMVPAFGGLCFTFQGPPAGNMLAWHTSYLNKIWLEAFHPSHGNKIGGSYATDGKVGVGTTPLKTGLARTLFMWDFDDWNPGQRENIPVRWLSYLRADPIQPGGALTFAMKLRVSADTGWRHLLEPYKAHFLETFGPIKYKTDQRMVGVAHVNRNKESISKENPYGFHGGRRLDSDEGVDAFCKMVLPGLQKSGGRGLIIWGQGGEEPRGQMYRSDFDILPPEVEKSWPLLQERFKAAGMELGVTARPRQMQIRMDWQNDGTIDINPDDPQHLEVMVWNRFKNMIGKGCTLFYLDTFGSSFDDVKTMRYLRGKMGPDIQTFVEHQCDAIAPYSGFYSEADFWAKGSDNWVKKDAWYPRTGLEFLEIVRWMLGPVPVITRGYDVHGKIPEGFESSNSFFYRHALSPMIEDYTISQFADEVKSLQEKNIDKNNQWKPKEK